jgi:uncharacterized protein YdhG (YjbR/CyaY superfamily)
MGSNHNPWENGDAMAMKKYATVEEYLAGQTPEFRKALNALRTTIRSALPKDAEERISYGMPAFYVGPGRPVCYYSAFKNHMSLFPGSSATLKRFSKELKGFKTGAGTVQFTVDKPLPAALVNKIVKARLAEKAAAKRNP